MSKYLTKWETAAAYNAAKDNLPTPQVAYIVENNTVDYKPLVPTPPTPTAETRVVATYYVEDTEEPTRMRILYNTSNINSIEIDGTVISQVVSEYTFDTPGEHTVKYTLTDPTTIGNNFSVDEGLVSIDIPDSVTTIGPSPFSDSPLRTCIIGSGVTAINSYLFYNNAYMRSLTIKATTPPTIGDYLLGGESSIEYIYVPSESVNIYKEAEGWSDYADIIQAIS